MELTEQTIYQLRLLLSKSLEGCINEQEADSLNTLLEQHEQARRYYLEYIYLHIGLRRLHQKQTVYPPSADDDILDIALWQELARSERTAASVHIEPAVQEKAQEQLVLECPKSSRQANKTPFYTLVISAAAIFLAILYFHLVPPPAPIAGTLTDSIGGQWGNPVGEVKIGEDIRCKTLNLASGIVTLTFDSGAVVVIEGPAEFMPLSSRQMRLISGKVFVSVPNTAIGFAIETSESSIVDLGTQFGVYADSRGGSEVHVFNGKVNLIAGLSGQPKQSEILLQSQARRVDAEEGKIHPAVFREHLFVQSISSRDNRIIYGPPVQLVSLAAEGNADGNKTSWGIDPANGQIHTTVIQGFGRKGTGGFQPVPERDFVDGVFVPNGPQVVSSAGHLFSGFPATSGEYWSDITSVPFIQYIPIDSQGNILGQQQLPAVLRPNAADAALILLLHTNAGITFDLNKIRRSYPGTEPARFKAVCGISRTALAKMRHEFWVLLDGQLAWHYRQQEAEFEQMAIDIPIQPNQGFLTLAATDGGDGISFDWCIFENPILELRPQENYLTENK